MEYTNTPITLPLPDSMTRCLAHGDTPHDWCERRGECAAHETIKHDGAGSQLVVYRKCQTDRYVGFVPMGGFAVSDSSLTDAKCEGCKHRCSGEEYQSDLQAAAGGLTQTALEC